MVKSSYIRYYRVNELHPDVIDFDSLEEQIRYMELNKIYYKEECFTDKQLTSITKKRFKYEEMKEYPELKEEDIELYAETLSVMQEIAGIHDSNKARFILGESMNRKILEEKVVEEDILSLSEYVTCDHWYENKILRRNESIFLYNVVSDLGVFYEYDRNKIFKIKNSSNIDCIIFRLIFEYNSDDLKYINIDEQDIGPFWEILGNMINNSNKTIIEEYKREEEEKKLNIKKFLFIRRINENLIIEYNGNKPSKVESIRGDLNMGIKKVHIKSSNGNEINFANLYYSIKAFEKDLYISYYDGFLKIKNEQNKAKYLKIENSEPDILILSKYFVLFQNSNIILINAENGRVLDKYSHYEGTEYLATDDRLYNSSNNSAYLHIGELIYNDKEKIRLHLFEKINNSIILLCGDEGRYTINIKDDKLIMNKIPFQKFNCIIRNTNSISIIDDSHLTIFDYISNKVLNKIELSGNMEFLAVSDDNRLSFVVIRDEIHIYLDNIPLGILQTNLDSRGSFNTGGIKNIVYHYDSLYIVWNNDMIKYNVKMEKNWLVISRKERGYKIINPFYIPEEEYIYV